MKFILLKEDKNEPTPQERIDALKTVSYEQFVELLQSDVKSQTFVDYLTKHYKQGDSTFELKSASYSEQEMECGGLIPTQNEISLSKSLNIEEKKVLEILSNPLKAFWPCIVYDGKYLIDGHHRWSEVYALLGPKAKVRCINFSKAQGIDWEDMLRAVQMAIVTQNPEAKLLNPVNSDNMLTTPIETVYKCAEKCVTDKVVSAYQLRFKNKNLDKPQICKGICKNVKTMGEKNQPVKGAPKRAFMPQTGKEGSVNKIQQDGLMKLEELQ